MPLGRYFLFVGSLLLALLFLVDWYVPALTAPQEQASNEHPAILIHSRHRWPEAVVFDTNQPTIVPPAALAAEALPEKSPQQAKSPTDAMAMAEPAAPMEQTAPPPVPAKRVAERRRPRVHHETRRVASGDMFGARQPFFFGGW